MAKSKKPEAIIEVDGEKAVGELYIEVGCIVRFTCMVRDNGAPAPKARAAIVTDMNPDGTVSLKVFHPTTDTHEHNVAFTEEAAGTEAAVGKWTL